MQIEAHIRVNTYLQQAVEKISDTAGGHIVYIYGAIEIQNGGGEDSSDGWSYWNSKNIRAKWKENIKNMALTLKVAQSYVHALCTTIWKVLIFWWTFWLILFRICAFIKCKLIQTNHGVRDILFNFE